MTTRENVMKTCVKHTHSTPETARRCYEKTLGKIVERKHRTYGTSIPQYDLVEYKPPLEVELKNVTVYYFYRGEPR